MKKTTLLLLLLSTVVWTFASDFKSGDLYYNITSDTTVAVTFQERSFFNYSGLTSAVIPESVTYNDTTYTVTTIAPNAFSGCRSLTSITIPGCVTDIRAAAFAYCGALTSIIIPNGVTTIGDNAFFDCVKLASVTIPGSITYIGEWAFEWCTGLTKTSFTGTIADWCKINFASASNPASYSHNLFISDTLVTDVVIPEEIKAIKNYTFSGLCDLTSVTTPDSVKSIGYHAFFGCTGLTSITIPNHVTLIGGGAFVDCTGITSITIPGNVTIIGQNAFHNCTGLTSVVCYAIQPPTAYSSFSGIDVASIPLYVPEESVEKYKVAECWKDFMLIFPISNTAIDQPTRTLPDNSLQVRKILHNGQVLILCGDKTYTVTGEEVK